MDDKKLLTKDEYLIQTSIGSVENAQKYLRTIYALIALLVLIFIAFVFFSSELNLPDYYFLIFIFCGYLAINLYCKIVLKKLTKNNEQVSTESNFLVQFDIYKDVILPLRVITGGVVPKTETVAFENKEILEEKINSSAYKILKIISIIAGIIILSFVGFIIWFFK